MKLFRFGLPGKREKMLHPLDVVQTRAAHLEAALNDLRMA
jgi:hypothetical protein